ncbi:hypothetical protein V6N11_032985 [Hibiscus sabdariffa]|uniref:Reverse transcriptase zinc-binding domain-containing protein n=1 Tax=Hibiscus sabdariffa TaxID=183260 RepID=A0ABR1ZMD9_9ROSI
MLGPIRSHLLHDVDASRVQHVSNLLDIHGRWDIEKLSSLFNTFAIHHLLSICCPDPSDFPDKPFWCMNDKNTFDVKSAYTSLASGNWDSVSQCWKQIWSLRVPQRLRFFLWLSHKGKLMTNMERYRRSLCHHSYCPYCHNVVKPVLHALRDCRNAQEIWKCLLPLRLHDSFFSCDTQAWLQMIVANHELHPTWGLSWQLLFASTLGQIWNNRNDLVFSEAHSNIDQILQRSVIWARYYFECATCSANAFSRIDHIAMAMIRIGLGLLKYRWCCLVKYGTGSAGVCCLVWIRFRLGG